MNFTTHISLLFILLSLSTYSQTTENKEQNTSLNSGSIESQFEYILSKSTNYNDAYGVPNKVVKLKLLTDLKTQVLDSLQAAQKKLMATARIVESQKQEISALNAKISLKQQMLTNAKDRGEDISILGTFINKTLYHTILLTIIAVLALVLIFLIYKYKDNSLLTNNAKVALSDLENEYEEHRKTNIEREQKLRRELLDEINKQKNIKAKN